MATLHLVNSVAAFERCRARCQPVDVVVLMHDGCYTTTDIDGVWLLAPHAQARGVEFGERGLGYDELVTLTEQHTPIVTWK